jgi:hypothetical protein
MITDKRILPMVTSDENRKIENAPFKTLTLVLTLAGFFLLWGFLLFYTIGDKGPPPWDFGVVPDIPGESVYSTHPSLIGTATEPEPQHVSQRPRSVEGEERRTGGR